jgi:MoxR-like ATPase
MESIQSNSFLRRLSIYGMDAIEPVILSALISEEPILLIGKAGTGKTYLLNLLSKALGLNHRHYNASQISFDDLIGFPFPEEKGEKIKFIPTPATIWEAESILVDELNRCKPEIQNKFFSLVHERKIMGMSLDQLQYRWAAMNPILDEDETYEGCEPLDPALADRFSFLIQMPDWEELDTKDQELIITASDTSPNLEGFRELKEFVGKTQAIFMQRVKQIPEDIIFYSRFVAGILNKSSIRISPRRARILARNILAVCIVFQELERESNKYQEFKLALEWSLPQRAFKDDFSRHIIDSVHAEAIKYLDDDSKKKTGG